MSDQKKALKEFCDYLEKMDRKHLALLHKYYAKDVHFHDPIHHIQGIDKLKQFYTHGFDQFDTLKIKIVSAQHDKSQSLGLIRWDYLRKQGKHSHVISGMSELTFDKDNKIMSQIDFWDVSALIKGSFPFIGSLVKSKKKKLRAVS